MNKTSEDSVREIAHRIWIEAGKPDGNTLVNHQGRMMRLQDLHWEQALLEDAYGKEHLDSRSF